MTYSHSPLRVIMIDDEGGRMDCEDDDPRKCWVVVSGWSYRRAVLTHAAPFMEAAGTEEITDLVGQMFMAKMDLGNPPPFEHEGGERIEFPELRLAKPMAEVYEDLGIEPPDDDGYPGGFPEYTMSFSDAAGFAEDWGATITREEWEDTGVRRFLRWDRSRGDYGVMVVIDGDKDPEVWRPTQHEVLNIDWCIVPQKD